MPPLMQRCNSNALRVRMLLLYALNILDMVVTKFLLMTGKFREVNPVMALALQSDGATLVLKLLLPAVLLVYLDWRLKVADARHLKLSARVLEVLIVAYCIVSMLHLWLYLISL
ncbi:MAG TPA: DUF5658 family protein [Clostridia bacterium]|nr:DUF5658 family protein [Clostridia bacterium]